MEIHINSKSSGFINLGDLSSFKFSVTHRNQYPYTNGIFCIIKSKNNVIFDGLFMHFVAYNNFLCLQNDPSKSYLLYNLYNAKIQSSYYPDSTIYRSLFFCELFEYIGDCSICFRFDESLGTDSLTLIPSSSNCKVKLLYPLVCESVYDTVTRNVYDIELEDVMNVVCLSPFGEQSSYAGMYILDSNNSSAAYDFYPKIYADAYIDSSMYCMRTYFQTSQHYFYASIVLFGHYSKISIPVKSEYFTFGGSTYCIYQKK